MIDLNNMSKDQLQIAVADSLADSVANLLADPAEQAAQGRWR